VGGEEGKVGRRGRGCLPTGWQIRVKSTSETRHTRERESRRLLHVEMWLNAGLYAEETKEGGFERGKPIK
jgi:hypothetical protein